MQGSERGVVGSVCVCGRVCVCVCVSRGAGKEGVVGIQSGNGKGMWMGWNKECCKSIAEGVRSGQVTGRVVCTM